MLANTLSLTIGSADPITLTRVSEQNGASTYKYRTTGIEVILNVRASTQVSKGVVFNVFNMSLEYDKAATVDDTAETYTASFTGRFESLKDPTFGANLSKALHVLGATVMANIANGEV